MIGPVVRVVQDRHDEHVHDLEGVANLDLTLLVCCPQVRIIVLFTREEREIRDFLGSRLRLRCLILIRIVEPQGLVPGILILRFLMGMLRSVLSVLFSRYVHSSLVHSPTIAG